MAQVKVKAGKEHFGTKDGSVHRYGPGSTMEVPDSALKGFMKSLGDKFDVVGGEVAVEEEPEEEGGELKDADRKTLLAAAEELGLKDYDKWSDKRLRKAVEKALKE